ncbi:MAG: hypothetical protein ACYDHD_00015 [Vulcanimicrobiaceae bacterium]
MITFTELQERHPTVATQAVALASRSHNAVTIILQPYGADLVLGDHTGDLKGRICIVRPSS